MSRLELKSESKKLWEELKEARRKRDKELKKKKIEEEATMDSS